MARAEVVAADDQQLGVGRRSRAARPGWRALDRLGAVHRFGHGGHATGAPRAVDRCRRRGRRRPTTVRCRGPGRRLGGSEGGVQRLVVAVGHGVGVAALDQVEVDQQAVVGPVQVHEQPAVAVAGHVVALEAAPACRTGSRSLVRAEASAPKHCTGRSGATVSGVSTPMSRTRS